MQVEVSPFSRAVVFTLLLACGLLVFTVYSQYYPMFTGTADVAGRVVLAAALLSAALFARQSERFRAHWRLPFAFFVGLMAVSLDFYLNLSSWIVPALGLGRNTAAAVAIDKLESSLLSILTVLLLVRASADGPASLFLRRGRLREGLTVGLIALFVVVVSVIPVTEAFFNGQDLSVARILPWTPWVLVFVLANAFNEELLFRGLFFGRMEPLLGRLATNVLVAVPFTLMHTGVEYTPEILPFLSLTFLLSLAWGHTLQKTDSIWGSVLFHAATDIYIAVSIFSNLP